MREADFYVAEGEKVICKLCPNNCSIGQGNVGVCGYRINQGGILWAKGYGEISSLALDPIEKKPLYHFYPGRKILSIGGLGCNLRCKFCQNWQIAHESMPTRYIEPEDIVDKALALDSLGIAYTYNEPLMGYEYVYDVAKLAKGRGLKNVLVTNGFINREPLERLLPYIDAMNIDVKAFDDRFYREVCAGSISPVKETVEIGIANCHVEITTLIINGLNDSVDEIRALAIWLSNLDRYTPLHLSRYYPNYKMHIPATAEETMLQLSEVAREYLPFVYIGNMAGVHNNTYCINCQNLLIERGYRVRILGAKEGRCNSCGFKVNF